MKEHPILFSGEMVRAILAEKKTQTRRVIRPQPKESEQGNLCGEWLGRPLGGLLLPRVQDIAMECPYGAPGDTLWVRESWNAQNQNGQWWHEVNREDRPLMNWAVTNPVYPSFESTLPRWLPSIHMPRWASRILLRVTDVRVQRVQDISEDEAKAEGVVGLGINEEGYDLGNPNHWIGFRNRFCYLWDSINAKRRYSWESNPWVWIIEFEKIGSQLQ